MSLENEALKTSYEEKQADKIAMEDIAEGSVESTEPSGFSIDFGFLMAKTGEGSIENYLEHPLNFKKSKGIAQMLRGATGLFGALDLAIIDIALGGINVLKEGKVNATYTGE